MVLATIDLHCQKEHTKIHKLPKFGVNRASFDWDTGIRIVHIVDIVTFHVSEPYN